MSYQSSLIKHDFKDKIIENFKIATAGPKTRVQGPWLPLHTATGLVLLAVKEGGEQLECVYHGCPCSRQHRTPLGLTVPCTPLLETLYQHIQNLAIALRVRQDRGCQHFLKREKLRQRGKCSTQNMTEGKRQGWLSNPSFQALGPAFPRDVPNFPTLSEALHITCLSRRRGL